jgi:hypothetical protein
VITRSFAALVLCYHRESAIIAQLKLQQHPKFMSFRPTEWQRKFWHRFEVCQPAWWPCYQPVSVGLNVEKMLKIHCEGWNDTQTDAEDQLWRLFRPTEWQRKFWYRSRLSHSPIPASASLSHNCEMGTIKRSAPHSPPL